MSAEADLTALEDLRARLTPGALCFSLATPEEAETLRLSLPQEGRIWVGWRQREALLRAWRPAAQERYHSVAGRDAPSLRAWLEDSFKVWRESGRGDWRIEVEGARVEEALALCGLGGLESRSLSLLSNGEAARACLAAALGSKPALLVLDDLTEGLDAKGRKMLSKLARTLAGKGTAVLVLASRESLFPWAAAVRRAPQGLSDLSLVPRPLSEEVFSCEGLSLEAGGRILVKSLYWKLYEGENWWVEGPNGAGKSTLLAYLSGEHPQAWAQSWRLKGEGREAWTPPALLRSAVAWVSPELAAASGRPLGEMLSRALESSASLLILDEALRGLDREALGRCEEDLARSFRERPGRSVVFVSHDFHEIPPGINRVLHLRGDGDWDFEE
ncbi:MAG TPA: ATP-binding cassette domain-containing protein [bacterium]|jgi:ABC-type molybdenum transport system ATPase subunit/photorepair protein PhrA|nr:ATP-binding cassette domain-containing protein [bacterium]